MDGERRREGWKVKWVAGCSGPDGDVRESEGERRGTVSLRG